MRRPTPTGKRWQNDALRRRLSLAAGEAQSHRADAAVQRVLALLSDENLASEAAHAPSPEGFELECGVLEQVWEDPRVYNRRGQLERQGVTVEQVEVETTVAGKTFRRTRLRVGF
ncbi:MAG: hypothetical protein KDC18_12960 [Alphaproteobacteria bacterium]|nr:hypothetical protein [Alphaproteobacteria bacterium]MCB9928418.1 hypothetical protein [Alphaproteobacteria bacterium]